MTPRITPEPQPASTVPSRPTPASPRPIAASATRCTRCSGSRRPPPPITMRSPWHRTSPTPGPISGRRLHHAGDFDEAMVALRRALAIDPNHINAHSGLGILLLMRGEFGEGLEEYEWRLLSTETKGPGFPQATMAGRQPRGTANLCAGRAGLWRYNTVRALPAAACSAQRRRELSVHQDLLDPDARQPAGHRRLRRPRRAGAVPRLRMCAVEPAPPAQNAA